MVPKGIGPAVVSLAVGLFVTSAAWPEGDALASDGRLSAPVTLSRYFATNDEVLRELTAATRVRLSATPPVGDFPSALVATGVPLREAMLRLAEAGGYEWRRQGPAEAFEYRLSETAESRRRAEESLRAERASGLAAVDRQVAAIAGYARQFAGMAPREVGLEVTRLREAAEALPISRERFLAEEAWQAARLAGDPETRGLALAWEALPAAQRAEVARGRRVLMALAYPGAVVMPEEVARAVREGRARQAEARRGGVIPVLPDANEVLSFTAGLRPLQPGLLRVAIRAQRYGAHPTAPALQLPRIALTPSRVQFAGNPEAHSPGRVTADTPAELAQRVQFVGERRKRTRDEVLMYVEGLTPAELLRPVAERNPRYRFAGDSPWRALSPDFSRQPPTPARNELHRLLSQGTVPLGGLLSLIAERGQMDIHLHRDGWITLRSLVPHDRANTGVDTEWLKSVFGDIADGKGQFHASVAVRAAAGLRPGQAESLGRYDLGFLRDEVPMAEFTQSYHGWRLLAGLPGRLRALTGGQAVRYGAVGEAERAAFREFVNAVSHDPDGAPLDVELREVGLSGLELAMAGERRATTPEGQAEEARRGHMRRFELRLTRPPLVLHEFWGKAVWEPS
jgi:hypothetical protein